MSQSGTETIEPLQKPEMQAGVNRIWHKTIAARSLTASDLTTNASFGQSGAWCLIIDQDCSHLPQGTSGTSGTTGLSRARQHRPPRTICSSVQQAASLPRSFTWAQDAAWDAQEGFRSSPVLLRFVLESAPNTAALPSRRICSCALEAFLALLPKKKKITRFSVAT